MAADRRVLLGRVLGAHGLKGEVRIVSFTARPEDITAYGALGDKEGGRRFEIEAARSAKGAVVIARLSGVSDREAAEKLRNTELYLPREALPSPGEDEFYHGDLLGIEAVAADGSPLGSIAAIYDFGAGDLLEIRLADTNETLLVPFSSKAVPELDLAARRAIIDYPFDEKAPEE